MKLIVEGQHACIIDADFLVRGSVGQYEMSYEFSDEWKDYDKVIVFDAGNDTPIEKAVEGQTGSVEIPWEVLDAEGRIRFGAYGLHDTAVRPTVWTLPAYIHIGVKPGETAKQPTILPWEELVRRIGQLVNLETVDKSSLVAAVNEVLGDLETHIADNVRHITAQERSSWNAKADIDDIPTTLSELEDDANHRTVTDEEKSSWNAKPDSSDIPMMLADLGDDSAHRLVTDAEKATWNAKQSAISDLDTIRSGAAAGATAVQSVNGKSGTSVTLTPADIGIGSVFTIKGSAATKAQLPATGNVIGDVYYVINESVGYIWLNDGTTTRWEMLGMTIDLSEYAKTAALNAHADDTTKHVTSAEKQTWNEKASGASVSALEGRMADAEAAITSHSHSISDVEGLASALESSGIKHIDITDADELFELETGFYISDSTISVATGQGEAMSIAAGSIFKWTAVPDYGYYITTDEVCFGKDPNGDYWLYDFFAFESSIEYYTSLIEDEVTALDGRVDDLEDAVEELARAKYTTQTVTIAKSAWGNNTVTVNVTGVTATSLVMITVPTKADMDRYGQAGVFCSAQGAGTLTFTCVHTPTDSITVNAIIWG